MAFEVPPLPYDYGALAPTIDEETMRLHHDKHHQAYVDNANKALAGTEHADSSVEQVLAVLDTLPEDIQATVRNNVGGHANHSLFWETMGPDGGGAPSGPLGAAINDLWGGLDEFKQAFNENGVKRFGSGWTWLVHDGTGLSLYSTAEPGLADPERRLPDPRERRLGARLLPHLPQPPARLPRGLVERRQLGGGRGALPGGARGDGAERAD